MKKLFTLIATVLMAVGVNAQTVIWEGEVTTDWSGAGVWGTDGGAELKAVNAKVGDFLKFKIEPLADSWQLWLTEGHWTKVAEGSDENVVFAKFNSWGNSLDAEGYATYEITEDMLSYATTAQGWGNIFIIQGNDAKLTQVVFTAAVPTTTTAIWEGNTAFGNWENGFSIGKDKFATAKAGDIMELVYSADTSTGANYHQFKTQYSDVDEVLTSNASELNEWNCATVPANGTSYKITLNETDVAKLKELGLYVGGYYCIVTQVNLIQEVGEAPSTGITAVKTVQQNAVRYNLAGQKVDQDYKGVVIENGKKIVVK